MYVRRAAKEKELSDSLNGSRHTLLFGESGGGKTWLYKHVLKEMGAFYETVNIGQVQVGGTLAHAMRSMVSAPVATSYTESKSGGASAGLLRAEVDHTGTFELPTQDPFLDLLRQTRRRAGKRPAALVFENFELARNSPLMDETSRLFILCDDERYAEHEVKLLLVGVPHGVREYFHSSRVPQSVRNRLYTMGEVSRLTPAECKTLVTVGFKNLLQYEVADLDGLTRMVQFNTDMIPDLVQAYCLAIAQAAEASRRVTLSTAAAAARRFVGAYMEGFEAMIASNMNSPDNGLGRRTQVIFAIGRCSARDFSAADIRTILQREFPTTATATRVDVNGNLSALAKPPMPLIGRSPAQRGRFLVADPRIRACIRSVLVKSDDERVEFIPQDSNL